MKQDTLLNNFVKKCSAPLMFLSWKIPEGCQLCIRRIILSNIQTDGKHQTKTTFYLQLSAVFIFLLHANFFYSWDLKLPRLFFLGYIQFKYRYSKNQYFRIYIMTCITEFCTINMYNTLYSIKRRYKLKCNYCFKW